MSVSQIYKAYSYQSTQNNLPSDKIKRRWVGSFTFMFFNWLENDDEFCRLKQISEKSGSDCSAKLLDAIRQCLMINLSDTETPRRYRIRITLKSRMLRDRLVDALDGNIIASARSQNDSTIPVIPFITEILKTDLDIVATCIFDEKKNRILNLKSVNRNHRRPEGWLEGHILRTINDTDNSIVFAELEKDDE